MSSEFNIHRQDEDYDLRKEFGVPEGGVYEDYNNRRKIIGKKDSLSDYYISDLISTSLWFLPIKDPTKVNIDKTYESLIYGNTLKVRKADCSLPHKKHTFELIEERLEGTGCEIVQSYRVDLIKCGLFEETASAVHVRDESDDPYLLVQGKSGSKVKIDIRTLTRDNYGYPRYVFVLDKNLLLFYRLYSNIRVVGQEMPIPVIAFQISSYKLGKKKRFSSNPF